MQQNKHTNCLSNKLLQMKKLILLTTVFFIFFSCKKSKPYEPFVIPCALTKDSSLAKQYIYGTWEWVEEKRASRTQADYIYLTPKTEGYSLKMIIGDSTFSILKDNNKYDYKYRIQLLGEISNTNFPEDSLIVFVRYRLSDGLRDNYVPIRLCNGYLVQEYQFVSSILGERIWRKL